MNKESLTAAATAASVAGLAGIFLPQVADAYKVDPTNEFFGYQLDRGTLLYLIVVLGIATLHSMAVNSILPLLVVGVVAGMVVTNLHTAFDMET